ncbi:MAG: SPFH domain-containing protein [Pirellulales bacterium]
MSSVLLRSIFRGVFSAALLAWLLTGVAIVGVDEIALYERFGLLQPEPLTSGWHWLWPAPWGRTYRFSRTRVALECVGPARDAGSAANESQTTLLCGGATEVVHLAAQLTYRPLATPAGRRARHLSEAQPERRLRRLAERLLSRVAAAHSLDSLLARDRLQLSQEMTAVLRADCVRADLGFEIIEFSLVHVSPPSDVRADYLDAMSAAIDAERDLANARIHAQGELTRMAMMSDSTVADAQGAAAVRRTTAAAQAQSLAALAEAYRKYPEAVRHQMQVERWGASLSTGRLVVWDAGLSSSVLLTLDNGTGADSTTTRENEERRQ